MKKFRLLLLDANVVIQLFRLGLWDKIVEKCEVLLARTVAEQEAKFYEIDDDRIEIDLKPDIAEGRIQVVDVEFGAVREFSSRFGPVYLEKMDPGETESLTYLVNSKDDCFICSADSIVFRILAALSRSEQGVSLEEILGRIGLSQKLPREYSKEYRLYWARKGGEEMIRGLDRKPS